MLFERQKLLVALLNALGGSIGNLDFQKLLFLYCDEHPELTLYEFVPYHYGAFSFTSYDDRRRLIKHKALEQDDRRWELTRQGERIAFRAAHAFQGLGDFAKRYARLRGDKLVAETYRRRPYYAILSEVVERVLAGDSAALAAVADARKRCSESGLVTIGYEGRSLESFLNLLFREGVSILCDVRRNPLSRKYGFSKGTLSKVCAGLGIRYEHLPELGVASENRRGLDSASDYKRLFALYRAAVLPSQSLALEQIASWVAAGHRVALTCYEEAPTLCHRHCVAEALEARSEAALRTTHL